MTIQIRTNLRWKLNGPKLSRRMRADSRKPLSRAAGAIRLTAKRSIRKRKKASPPGQPPSTRRGKLRDAIRYDVDAIGLTAVIGPSRDLIGPIAGVHEFGGTEPRRRPNWQLRIGGHGPLGYRSGTSGGRNSRGQFTKARKGGLIVARLRTDRQVARARQVADTHERMLATQPPKRFPQRAFMRPALDKMLHRIPAHWAGSLRGG